MALELPSSFIIAIAFLFGLAIGSFLNVVIHRIPRGLSVVRPGSRCPQCQKPLRPFDNIPLLSFLLLRRRCRNCRAPISWIYPTTELLTAVIFALIVYRRGLSVTAATELWFAGTLIALIAIDARHHLLPDRITYPALLTALVAIGLRAGFDSPLLDPHVSAASFEPGFSKWQAGLVGAAVLAGAIPAFWLLDLIDLILFNKYFEWEEHEEADLEKREETVETSEEDEDRSYRRLLFACAIAGLVLAVIWVAAVVFDSHRHTESYQLIHEGWQSAVLGAAVGAVPLWLMRAFYFYTRGVEGLGLGDIKMMAVVGVFFGWIATMQTLILGSVLGLVLGLVLAARRGSGLQTRLPLGVCLGSAALIILLISDLPRAW